MSAFASTKNEIRVLDRFPMLIVEFHGAPDDDEFAAYIAKIEAISEQRASRKLPPARVVILFDTTHATRAVTASQRRMQADHMSRMKAKALTDGTRDEYIGVCFVLANTLLRGVLTAVLWLHPMSQRYEVCATRKEADEWCTRWVRTPLGDEVAVRAKGG